MTSNTFTGEVLKVHSQASAQHLHNKAFFAASKKGYKICPPNDTMSMRLGLFSH